MAKIYYYPQQYDYLHSGVNSYTPRRNKKKKRFYKFFTIFIFLSVVIFGGIMTVPRLFSEEPTTPVEFLSPLVEPIQTSVKSAVISLFSGSIESIVKDWLEGKTGDYSVAIKHLKTGEEYYYNPHQEYRSASLYKLWVLATAYEQIEAGTISKDKRISSSIENLNSTFGLSSDEAELTEGGIDKTVEDAMEQMITISHNYSALLLMKTLKTSNVSNFLKEQGLVDSRTGGGEPPSTTAFDTLVYYDKLYHGVIVNPEYSQEMLDILKRQKLNDRIPKYLPNEVAVAHKTGELGGVKHDAGIVYAPSGDYIFVVLSESNNPKAAAENIAVLSQQVYEYFENK